MTKAKTKRATSTPASKAAHSKTPINVEDLEQLADRENVSYEAFRVARDRYHEISAKDPCSPEAGRACYLRRKALTAWTQDAKALHEVLAAAETEPNPTDVALIGVAKVWAIRAERFAETLTANPLRAEEVLKQVKDLRRFAEELREHGPTHTSREALQTELRDIQVGLGLGDGSDGPDEELDGEISNAPR